MFVQAVTAIIVIHMLKGMEGVIAQLLRHVERSFDRIDELTISAAKEAQHRVDEARSMYPEWDQDLPDPTAPPESDPSTEARGPFTGVRRRVVTEERYTREAPGEPPRDDGSPTYAAGEP